MVLRIFQMPKSSAKWIPELTPPLKIPLGRAVKNLIARLFFSAHISGSFILKKLVLHSNEFENARHKALHQPT